MKPVQNLTVTGSVRRDVRSYSLLVTDTLRTLATQLHFFPQLNWTGTLHVP